MAPQAQMPFAIADEEKVKKLKEQQKKVQDIMELVKEYWLENDKEFMKEIFDSIGSALPK